MSDAPRPTGRPNARLRQTAGDMVRSLAVVLGAVAVLLLITMRPQPDPVRVIDPGSALAQARASADYPVLYPEGLSADWKLTSVRFEPTADSAGEPVWHLGFVTPEGEYVQVAQSASDSARFVEGQVGGGPPEGEGPAGWQRYVAADGTRSVVTVVDGVTIVVSGTAEFDVLGDVAQRLSPTAPAVG